MKVKIPKHCEVRWQGALAVLEGQDADSTHGIRSMKPGDRVEFFRNNMKMAGEVRAVYPREVIVKFDPEFDALVNIDKPSIRRTMIVVKNSDLVKEPA